MKKDSGYQCVKSCIQDSTVSCPNNLIHPDKKKPKPWFKVKRKHCWHNWVFGTSGNEHRYGPLNDAYETETQWWSVKESCSNDGPWEKFVLNSIGRQEPGRFQFLNRNFSHFNMFLQINMHGNGDQFREKEIKSTREVLRKKMETEGLKVLELIYLKIGRCCQIKDLSKDE